MPRGLEGFFSAGKRQTLMMSTGITHKAETGNAELREGRGHGTNREVRQARWAIVDDPAEG